MYTQLFMRMGEGEVEERNAEKRGERPNYFSYYKAVTIFALKCDKKL